MSHTVRSKTQLTDRSLILKVAEKMKGCSIVEPASVRLYDGTLAKSTDTCVKFDNWQYPIIVDGEGAVFYDNYDGAWGEEKTLDDFLGLYNKELIEQQAQTEGWFLESLQETEDKIVFEYEVND